MSNAQIYGMASVVCAFLVFIVCLNVWYRVQRANMTQVERDEDDSQMGIW